MSYYSLLYNQQVYFIYVVVNYRVAIFRHERNVLSDGFLPSLNAKSKKMFRVSFEIAVK